MYSWIWRHLPFGLAGKLIGTLLLATAALALLWFIVFPWAEPLLPFDDVQVTQDGYETGDSDFDLPGDGPNPDTGESGDEHAIPYDTTAPGDGG
ncbi:hypothetical protein [Melissospora conviva]|uniref:hypothetical protein n=1 Tax=Melissospora conviva TaxID=3388432 RepID=UPI003C1B59BA